jgi:hypothetical protein
MFNIGALSPNDIRRKENENPVEGGDEHFVPLNMVPLEAGRAAAGAAIGIGILTSCRRDPDSVTGLPEFLANVARAAARAHVVTSATEIRRTIKENDAASRAAALTALLNGWEADRAAADGVKECNELARQVGDFVYRALGLPSLETQPEAA